MLAGSRESAGHVSSQRRCETENWPAHGLHPILSPLNHFNQTTILAGWNPIRYGLALLKWTSMINQGPKEIRRRTHDNWTDQARQGQSEGFYFMLPIPMLNVMFNQQILLQIKPCRFPENYQGPKGVHGNHPVEKKPTFIHLSLCLPQRLYLEL